MDQQEDVNHSNKGEEPCLKHTANAKQSNFFYFLYTINTYTNSICSHFQHFIYFLNLMCHWGLFPVLTSGSLNGTVWCDILLPAGTGNTSWHYVSSTICCTHPLWYIRLNNFNVFFGAMRSQKSVASISCSLQPFGPPVFLHIREFIDICPPVCDAPIDQYW